MHSNDDQGRVYQIVNIMTHGDRVLILARAWPYTGKSLWRICIIFYYINIWHIYGIIMLLSNAIVDFYLFYNGVVHMIIWVPLTRSQCRVSDAQVTPIACGPLVLQFTIMRYCEVIHIGLCNISSLNVQILLLIINTSFWPYAFRMLFNSVALLHM